MARVELTIQDSGVVKTLGKFKMDITLGIHAEENTMHGSGPLSIAQVMMVNEFGGGNIPARPLFSDWFADHFDDVSQELIAEITEMVTTQEFESAPFEQIADTALESLKDEILMGLLQPENAPKTLALKAPEDRPLFETGELVESFRARMRAQGDQTGISWEYEAD